MATLVGMGGLAMCAAAGAWHAGSQRVSLDAIVSQNCDGSVDITTTTMMPCGMAPTVYTSMAPTVTTTSYPAPLAPPTLPAVGNTYQYPTVWSGDHVLNGGQPEWAAEDAAQHALNLANWRIKLLEAKKEQARLSKEVMTTGNIAPSNPGGDKKKAGKKEAGKKKGGSDAQLKGIEKSVLALATETRKAIGAIESQIDCKGGDCGKKATSKKSLSGMDKKLGGILRQMGDISDEYRQ